ncbi:MAG: demethoxyubiquinone hydroxylase family protein, partial [Sinobacteraceae bacterium]|nr:demethoxyubiquinone hydroxylase family protein [Nevskiaceae bacterium]
MDAERLLDPLITTLDRALRAVLAPARAARPMPEPAPESGPTASASASSATAPAAPAAELSEPERRTAAALMRVNHSGEVAAQALYHGQALLARDAGTRELLLQAARDETDHLAWCQDRLHELDSRPSRLAPVWYAG